MGTYPDLPCTDSDSRERPPQEASASPCEVSKCIPPAPAVGELTERKPEAHTPVKKRMTRKINKSAAARAKQRRIKRRGKDIPCSRSLQYEYLDRRLLAGQQTLNRLVRQESGKSSQQAKNM